MVIRTLQLNTFKPRILLLFWIVYLECIPRNIVTIVNQSDYSRGEKYVYKFGFKRICPRLRKESIRIKKARRERCLSLGAAESQDSNQ